ncbi:MAG: MBL fold metallo-hydrolase [Planctomycetota bacterium]
MSVGLSLRFLGTGTSAGVPMIGCRCETCTSTDPRDRRSRCSVVVTHGETSVLVDTTPELRLQCVDNDVTDIDAVVFTHAHADHIAGLDDLRRFNALKGTRLDLWADAQTHGTLSRMFPYAFLKPGEGSPKLFRPSLVARMIEGPFEIGEMRWTPVRYPHSNVDALGFRVDAGGRSLAYCTDCNAMPTEAREHLRGLDLLVIDALQWRKHPTHLTIDEALEVVDDLQPARTLFTHMSHEVLFERDAPKLPEGVAFAIDGMLTEIS